MIQAVEVAATMMTFTMMTSSTTMKRKINRPLVVVAKVVCHR